MKSLFNRFIDAAKQFFNIKTEAEVSLEEIAKFKAARAYIDAKEVPVYRSRQPNSNRAIRRKLGIPHGVSGAKLARKALSNSVGLAAIR